MLNPTGADPDASGLVDVKVNRRTARAQMRVRTAGLDSHSSYDVLLGVRIGTLVTNGGGRGRTRFSTRPRGKDQLLGTDPRGRLLQVANSDDGVVLEATISDATIDPDEVRCCLPDDSGTECEDRTTAECAAQGGVDLGPGSCVPNPCETTAPPAEDDIRCCLPDDSGPECADRTPAECVAQDGINIGAGSCTPNPCAGEPSPAPSPSPTVLPTPAPTPSPETSPSPTNTPDDDDDIRCCVPDDSGPECEDRTPAECAARGGTDIGPGSCVPNPCP